MLKWIHKRPKIAPRYYWAHPYRSIYCRVEKTPFEHHSQRWCWFVIVNTFHIASGRCDSFLMGQRIAENVAEMYYEGDVI